jgi:VCBS repeat-containing protein
LPDKNFKVKNKLVIAGLTNSSGVLLSSGHEVDSHTTVPTQYGGTGTTQSPNAGQVLYSSAGTTYTPTDLSSLVSSTTPQSVSSNITMQKNYAYFVDTSATRTLTLPANPSLGDTILIYDASGTAATNNITISRNSSNINGVADDAIIDVNQASSAFVYTGAAVGWRFD